MLSRRQEALIRRLGTRRRGKEGLFLAEGVRVVEEALAAGLPVELAILSPRLTETPRGRAVAERMWSGAFTTAEVEDRELGELSDTHTSQGVLLVVREPPPPPGLPGGGAPRLLVLDALQDPGNVGTLLRAARAFGLDGAVLLDGTADPWSPKVVRAAAGALFRLPILRCGAGRAVALLEEGGVRLLVADAGGEDVTGVDPGGGE